MTRGETRAAVSETTARGLGVERFAANAKASGSTRSRRTRIPDGLPTASACRSGFAPAAGADERNAGGGGGDAREGDPSTRRNLRASAAAASRVSRRNAHRSEPKRAETRVVSVVSASRDEEDALAPPSAFGRDQKRLAVHCERVHGNHARVPRVARCARAVAGTTSITSLSSPSTTGRATCADAFRHRAERVCLRREGLFAFVFSGPAASSSSANATRSASISTTPRLCSSARSRLRASCGKRVFSGPGSDAASLCPGSKRVSREESANETRRSSTREENASRGDAAASAAADGPDPEGPAVRSGAASANAAAISSTARRTSASSSSSSSSVFVFAFSPTLPLESSPRFATRGHARRAAGDDRREPRPMARAGLAFSARRATPVPRRAFFFVRAFVRPRVGGDARVCDDDARRRGEVIEVIGRAGEGVQYG